MKLGMLSFLLAIAWIVVYFVFHIGGWAHLLLVVAIILSFARIVRKPIA